MPLRPQSSKPTAGGATPRAPAPTSAAAAAAATSAQPMLTPAGKHQGKAGMTLTRSFTLIGSRQRAHLHLVSQTISKAHAFIVNTETGLYIRDLASRTHVIVNGEPVLEADLRDGDLVTLGSFTFKFTDAPGARRPGKPVPAPPAVLAVEGQVESFPFTSRAALIGRRPTCNIALSGEEVSTSHAVIFEMNGNRFIRDLGSRTGTFVNDVQVNGHKYALQFGDRIRIGDVTFVYSRAEEHDTAESLDELEDLVGTAPIGAEHPEPEIKAPPRPAAQVRLAAPAVEAPRPARPVLPAAKAPPPLPPIPVARREVDLDAELAEPDLAEPAEETVALPGASPPPLSPPGLSPRVVEEPEEPSGLEWAHPHGSEHDAGTHDLAAHDLAAHDVAGHGVSAELPLEIESAVHEHGDLSAELGLSPNVIGFTPAAPAERELPAHEELPEHAGASPASEHHAAPTAGEHTLPDASGTNFGLDFLEEPAAATHESELPVESALPPALPISGATLAPPPPIPPPTIASPAEGAGEPKAKKKSWIGGIFGRGNKTADVQEAPAAIRPPPPIALAPAPSVGSTQHTESPEVESAEGHIGTTGHAPPPVSETEAAATASTEPVDEFADLDFSALDEVSGEAHAGGELPLEEFPGHEASSEHGHPEVATRPGSAVSHEVSASPSQAGHPPPMADHGAEIHGGAHADEAAPVPLGTEGGESGHPFGSPHPEGESEALLEAAPEDAGDLSWLDGEFPAEFGAGPENAGVAAIQPQPSATEFGTEAHESAHHIEAPAVEVTSATVPPIAGSAHVAVEPPRLDHSGPVEHEPAIGPPHSHAASVGEHAEVHEHMVDEFATAAKPGGPGPLAPVDELDFLADWEPELDTHAEPLEPVHVEPVPGATTGSQAPAHGGASGSAELPFEIEGHESLEHESLAHAAAAGPSAIHQGRPVGELADEVLASEGLETNGVEELPADFFAETGVAPAPAEHGLPIETALGVVGSEHAGSEHEAGNEHAPDEPGGHSTGPIEHEVLPAGHEAAAPIEIQSPAHEHEAHARPESTGASLPHDPFAFPEVISPEKDLSDSIFDVEVPVEHVVPRIEQAPSVPGQPGSHADANVLEGDILEPEVIEPEFGESKPYRPHFVDAQIVDKGPEIEQHHAAQAEIVPPLPFESGDALASEPLVPLTPEHHEDFVSSEYDQPAHGTGTGDLDELADLSEGSGDLDEFLDWPETPEQPVAEPMTAHYESPLEANAEHSLVVEPPGVERGGIVESPPPITPPTTLLQSPASDWSHVSATSSLPSISPVEATSSVQTPPIAPPIAPPTVPPVAGAKPVAPAIGPVAFNPMFGMSRDMASFIGGLPLALPELPKPKLPFSQVAVTFDTRPGAPTYIEQPLIGAMDLLSSSEPTITTTSLEPPATPTFESYSGQVGPVSVTPPGSAVVPGKHSGTLEGWSELPDLVEPELDEELEGPEELPEPIAKTKAPPQPPAAPAPPVADAPELHPEELHSDQHEGPGEIPTHEPLGPHSESEGGLEEIAWEELSAPEVQAPGHGSEPGELPEFDHLELSGLGEVPGTPALESLEPHEHAAPLSVAEGPPVEALHPEAQAVEEKPSEGPLEWEPEFEQPATVPQAGQAPDAPGGTDDLIFEDLASEPPVAPLPAPPSRPSIRPPAKTPPKKVGRAVRPPVPGGEAPGKITPPLSKPRQVRGPTSNRGPGASARGRAMDQSEPSFSDMSDIAVAVAEPEPLHDDLGTSIDATGAARAHVTPSNGERRKPLLGGLPRPGAAPVPPLPTSKARAPAPPPATNKPPGLNGVSSPRASVKGPPPVPAERAGSMPPGLEEFDAGSSVPEALPPASIPRIGGKHRLLLVLVGVVLLLTVAAIAAVVFWRFHNQSVKGVLQFNGSSNLSAAQRAELRVQQQQLLADPALRARAMNIAREKGTSPGFLGDSPAAASDIATIAATADWDEKGEQLVLTKSGTDAADKPRMSALLDALYVAQRAKSDDKVAQLHAARAVASRKLDDITSKLEDLDRRIRRDTDSSNSADALKAQAAELKASLEALVKDRDAAESRVRALEAEIKPLEPSVSVTGAPTTSPAAASTAMAAANPDDDEQVRQLTAEQERLDSSLKAAKDARDAQASQAATLLDTAQKQFDAQIQAARKAAGDDGAMSRFLATLKDQEERIRQLNDELVQQQKDQRQWLDTLKDTLARRNAARLKQEWDQDTGPGGLKDMEQHLAVAEHRYNTAVGAKLPEADGIKATMVQLNKEIKARQDLLANKDLYNPVIKDFQDAIDQAVGQMEANRARNETRLQEVLQGFEKARPQTEKLPAEQQALAAQLDESSKALKEARARYNKTQEEINARSDAIVQGLAGQVAAQQAKIDDRKKQLAIAASQIPTPEQLAREASARESGRQSEYQRKQDELTLARTAQADVTAKCDGAMQQYLTLSAQARDAKEAAGRLDKETADMKALGPEKQDAEQRLQTIATQIGNVVEPLRPMESSVTLEGDDPRMTYLLWVVCGGLSLTFVMLLPLLLARHPQPFAQAMGMAHDGPSSANYDTKAMKYPEEDYEADKGYAEPALTKLRPALAPA